MQTTLRPEDRISHYRITRPLGTGGMGEVYAAVDETLERDVALKVLPPRLVRSEERLRRFIAEAKSASSLNHPNIVTIYEIGEGVAMRGAGAPPGGARGTEEPTPDTASIRFISMELVTGETLGRKIHEEQEELRTLVGYVAQAAEGVARAHASGIVHRDLKPGNIMVSSDGLVKVLDFGLAKLTEKQPAPAGDMTSAPTEGPLTGEGVVMGTVGYMSPEQVMAKPADHRSDIFSMGCILYEAATRRAPFAASTDVEIMHRILRDRPAPVEELNASVPAELRRIIRRCLAKQADDRIQSMKDLAIDLRELAERWDTLEAASHPSAALPIPDPSARPVRRAGWVAGIATACLVGIAALAFGLYSWLGGGRPQSSQTPLRQMKLSILMNRNDLDGSTLSGDGRYLAYVATSGNRSSLSVRQVRTGSEVPIVPPQDFPIKGISFSPDGDYLYFLNRDPKLPNYQALFQVASLGGTPRKVVFDVDTAVTFAPGGKQICFRRGILDAHADSLVLFDLETGKERELARVKEPERFASPLTSGAPAWSPDGRRIAVPVFDPMRGARTRIVTIDAQSGKLSEHGSQPWLFVFSLGWVPDSSAVMLSAMVLGSSAAQIYRLSIPQGEARRVTNDLDGYTHLSLSSDGKTIAAVRLTGIANLWIAPVGTAAEPRPITFVSGGATSVDFIEPLADGGIAFSAGVGDRVVLWRIEADGTGRRQLSSKGMGILNLGFAERAGIVYTQVSEDATLHVWRVRPDGTDLKQVTQGHGEGLFDVAPDGATLLFGTYVGDTTGIWSQSVDGGEPKLVAPLQSYNPISFSPDGRYILYTALEKTSGHDYPKRMVIPAAGGEPVAGFLLPPGAQDLNWAPEGESITYIDRATGSNLMRRAIHEDNTRQLTQFKEGSLLGHRWSHDGKKILLHRRIGQEASLWILEADAKTPPSQLVAFKSGEIFRYAWARDSKSVVFTYGQQGQDVVLMTDFD